MYMFIMSTFLRPNPHTERDKSNMYMGVHLFVAIACACMHFDVDQNDGVYRGRRSSEPICVEPVQGELSLCGTNTRYTHLWISISESTRQSVHW